MVDLGHQNQPLPNKPGRLYTLVLENFIVNRIIQSNRCYSCLDCLKTHLWEATFTLTLLSRLVTRLIRDGQSDRKNIGLFFILIFNGN